MIPQPFQRIVALGDRHSWHVLTDRVSYIQQAFVRPGKGGRSSKIKAVYLGFDTWEEASRFRYTAMSRLKSSRASIRVAVRTTDYAYEVKVQGDFSFQEVEAIAQLLDNCLSVPSVAVAPSSVKPQVAVSKTYWGKVLGKYAYNSTVNLTQRRAIASYA